MAVKGTGKSGQRNSRTSVSSKNGNRTAKTKASTKKTAAARTGAASKTSASAKVNSAGKSRKEKADPQISEAMPSELNNELILLATLVVSVLLFLSNFSLSGKFGEIINSVTFGLFGFLAYLIPFLLFFGIAFYLANHHANKRYIGKLLASLGLFAVISGIIQLSFGEMAKDSVFEYYKYAAEHKNGGGFLGGLLCTLFVPAFGKAGSYVVLIALAVLFVMLLTGKALFALLADYGVASAKRHREQRRLREEEDALYEQQELELMETTRAQSFLLKPETEKKQEEEEKKPPKKNFFGGISPTAPVGREATYSTNIEQQNLSGMQETMPVKESRQTTTPELRMDSATEQLVYNGIYTPSKETVDAVNSIYEEELRKKFDHVLDKPAEPQQTEEKPTYKLPEPVPHFGNMPEPRAVEPFEPSFSEQSLSDRRRMEAAPREKTIFERAPYGMDTSPVQRNAQSDVETDNNSTEIERMSAQTEKVAKAENRATAEDIAQVAEKAAEGTASVPKKYVFPPIDLLARPSVKARGTSEAELHETANKLKNTLESFGVGVTITNVSRGPSVTRYELQPEQGVKVSKITNLADDIKLNLAAADVRIEAPIPGKAAVGIEVPNKENTAVLLRELIESPEFIHHPSDIAFTVGKDIGGQNIVADIGKMPHLLIAGATGSGKSVCINTIIMSILYKANPADVKLIMVDPKVVELSVYNGIPHLMIPVVTDPKKASAALNWAVAEMTDRYQKFAELSVRDLKGYNERVEALEKEGLNASNYPKLPRIVIIVDELADLMMVAPGEVEDAICRLAQMARAAGLHLILATQRPSVNVITGLIKANVPSRVAFAVSSGIDSRTILDAVGAEKLLGKGDMLFFPSGYTKPVRIQGAFVSDKEVSAVVEFLKGQTEGAVTYNEEITNRIASGTVAEAAGAAAGTSDNGRDEYFAEAGRFIIEKDKASIGMLQRVYKIGFNRAARIMDQLADAGVVGPEEGTKPRKILMTQEEFEQFLQGN
ncbi:MAG: DNA translocase FtsK 4TM domain-containing protein [Lachnospiraceae bacterium]